ncbi:hypothetical protein AO1008_10377 [Aspergillus oryzae 100-8]|uniref:FAD/NAD(P)-binding domain-containing protein n=1 Tax=Aspergillus oryzae (strain 3.042) TaxID=1160506 RepID=I8A309_ASPO3|nr:hypothetical protein Ao3042_04388 [Aspergillus oryzae 3.042]KDE83748.1 hypothetical protein AO1008_10377 [Aspergillus oryzae 100-8]|eukprot:EIT79307.1 hypothetical protein Ao3042_04388 [Aspergillus oryzae 3.042]
MESYRDKPILANRMMRVICIGAGPSGLYLAYRLETSFTGYMLEVYEKNEYIGGTWFENRYPGCERKYPWNRHICNHRVVGANWDDVSSQWKLRVEDPKKEVFERRCDFLIDGTGYLNSWRWLSISGLGSFNRRLLHTANWDGSFAVNWKAGRVDWEWFARSSGIQLLPELQRTAGHGIAFMRRPTWVIPEMRYKQRRYTDEEKQTLRDNLRKLL